MQQLSDADDQNYCYSNNIMILSIVHFIRTVIGLIDLVLLTCFLYLLSYLPNKYIKKWYSPIFYYWCNVFARALRVDLFLHQKNHKRLPKQYILIGNHPSAFEDVGMPALFKARFLAKKEVEHWPIVGRISRAAGTLYFDRENKESRQDASNRLLDTLKAGDSIGIYPEGGCKGRRIHIPFRFGIFEVAIQSGVPLLPVFIHYEAQESFEWQHQHLLYKLWMILTAQNRRANYYVYDAIDPQKFKNKQELCHHVEQLYLEWQRRYLD